MTYAPQTYKDAQKYICAVTGLPAVSVGLVGDAAHGTSGYHLGWDRVKRGKGLQDYSYRESSRDRAHITDASSAIDIGWFSIRIGGRTVTLIDFNNWLIAECRRSAPDTSWIREVIYTTDRRTVRRWDRLGIRSNGDSSHLTHTHLSGFRDAENTPKRPLFERFFTTTQGDNDMTPAESSQLLNLYNALFSGGTSMGNPVPGKVNPNSTGNALIDLVQHIRSKVDNATTVDPAQVATALAANTTFVDTLAAAIAAQVNLGAGATPEQVEEIVDRQLDQAFRGGADNDTPTAG